MFNRAAAFWGQHLYWTVENGRKIDEEGNADNRKTFDNEKNMGGEK